MNNYFCIGMHHLKQSLQRPTSLCNVIKSSLHTVHSYGFGTIFFGILFGKIATSDNIIFMIEIIFV